MIKLAFSTTIFGATYDCNAYGAGTYNEAGECVATTGTTEQANSGGALAATGQDVYVGVGAGLLLMATAVVLLIRNRKKAKN